MFLFVKGKFKIFFPSVLFKGQDLYVSIGVSLCSVFPIYLQMLGEQTPSLVDIIRKLFNHSSPLVNGDFKLYASFSCVVSQCCPCIFNWIHLAPFTHPTFVANVSSFSLNVPAPLRYTLRRRTFCHTNYRLVDRLSHKKLQYFALKHSCIHPYNLSDCIQI